MTMLDSDYKLKHHLAFSTARADVYFIDHGLAQPFQDYLIANRERLSPFEPLRDSQYYEINSICERIDVMNEDFALKRGLYLVFTRKDATQIIGNINYTGFMYGVFQAGYLGFSVDRNVEGQGLMTEVLQASIEYVRQHYGLHRIMANHLPNNKRSETLLKKLGFEIEGYAKSYLKINGKWRDHVLNSFVFNET